MNRISVSEPVLRWALDRSTRKSSLEQRFPKLAEWLSGSSSPTLRQLESLAKATSTPLGYFFLPEPPKEHLSIPHFRTLDSEHPIRPSPDMLEMVQEMERRQAWMREYLIKEGQEPLNFVHSAQLTIEPVRLAEDMRRTLGLAK
ncbi:MAG: hypothetical protein WBL87_09515, partial [Methanothrix sp.]